jgi:hypothetical protein
MMLIDPRFFCLNVVNSRHHLAIDHMTPQFVWVGLAKSFLVFGELHPLDSGALHAGHCFLLHSDLFHNVVVAEGDPALWVGLLLLQQFVSLGKESVILFRFAIQFLVDIHHGAMTMHPLTHVCNLYRGKCVWHESLMLLATARARTQDPIQGKMFFGKKAPK